MGKRKTLVVSGQKTKLSDGHIHERYTEWHGGSRKVKSFENLVLSPGGQVVDEYPWRDQEIGPNLSS